MNKHSDETCQRFVELRARGWSLDRIAAGLHVTKRTLVAWQRKFQAEIDHLQRLEHEALRARLLPSQEQELTRLATRLDQVEAVLARRKLECLSTEFLFCLAASLRAQIRKQCAKPMSAPDSSATVQVSSLNSQVSDASLNPQPSTAP